VSFDVSAGQIFGLIGPNGAGKTTTLECVLGLIEPDDGSIWVDGMNARTDPHAVKAKVGAQLQDSELPEVMTPRQALKLCAAFYREAANPEELIDRFQLREKANTRYGSLSGGQRQRLALALAFVNRPKVVVLDEPTAGLDPPSRAELHKLIVALRERGTAVVFTTHYLEEARLLCDRVALLNRGLIVAAGAPEELIGRSSVRPVIQVRTSPALPDSALRALPDAANVTRTETHAHIVTSAPVRTLQGLTAAIEAHGAILEDLQIARPTLDDVFLELTK
jgi:ABC-2 type transport system ATP-binding protein